MFPVFLKLTGRPVLVVGGGVVASGKIDALVRAGAEVTVVAPAIADAIRRMPVTCETRPFEPADLDGAWMVVAAAPPEVNRVVAEHAHARHLFVNAVDDPANASAYLGGVLRRDAVTIAISTSGRAPALAGLLREGLDALLPLDLDAWFARADALKREWRSRRVPMEARRPQLLDALVALYAGRTAVPRPGLAAAGAPGGFASLVGAGPGDPGLLTVRAVERLRAADVVFHDGLVPEAVVDLATAARHVSVARRAGDKDLTQDAVNAMMIDAARRGLRVVRLKSGDPFVFGRGGEEARALAAAGVPFDVVPGVSAALAAPALAGIPVTHRGLASGFLVLSGHAPAAYVPLLSALAPDSVTVVVLMGLAERAGIRAALGAAGWNPATPAAVVTNASHPDQQVWTGTLDELDRGRDIAPIDEAGVIVIGPVVQLASDARLAVPHVSEEISWLPTTTSGR
jgi:uroporphyrin-III C-methyltransferase/precorrin-2 dehydrogenase/sirohydrochlorin ferrochelatase